MGRVGFGAEEVTLKDGTKMHVPNIGIEVAGETFMFELQGGGFSTIEDTRNFLRAVFYILCESDKENVLEAGPGRTMNWDGSPQ